MKTKKYKYADTKWTARATQAVLAAAHNGEVFDRADCVNQLPFPEKYKVKYEAFDDVLNGMVKAGVLEERRVTIHGVSGRLWSLPTSGESVEPHFGH